MKKLISIIMSICLVLTALALVPATAGAAGTYYLVGSFNNWSESDNYVMQSNSSFDGLEEYMISLDLHYGDELKVKSSDTWYPDGDNNFLVNEDGKYNIYFRPNYDGYDDWHYKTIFVERTGSLSPGQPYNPGNPSDPYDPYQPYEPEKILLGDADGNGSVNVFDASYILKGTTGASGYPDYSTLSSGSREVKVADVDSSGTANVFDAALVLRYTSGDTDAIALGIGREITI